MLKGENIICISWIKWDYLPVIMHHMMKRLSENNRILYVDPSVALTTSLFHPRSLGSLLERMWFWFKGVERVTKNIHVYYPPPVFLQYGHLAISDRLNQFYLGHLIARIAKKLNFCSPILWLYDPYAVKPEGQFSEKLICYDCNDDISSFANLKHKKQNLFVSGDELVKKAHVIFTTSRNLYHAKKEKNPNTYYFPSGVDFEHFHQALDHSCRIPDDVRNLAKPIVGFVGSITNYRINWEWIKCMSISRPEWSIVFIGPCFEPPPHEISKQKNIHFLGQKGIEQLPGYLKAFDVCIIPYQGETFLKSCQPTKTFEYLAAGKPVVASDIPELKEYQPMVKLCKNTEEFISKVAECLAEGMDHTFVEKRIEIPKAYTWEARVEGTSLLIQQALENKQKQMQRRCPPA
ncbi:MAG: glycosyltransferase [Candidatus Brocadia sp.]|nr:glycosyltransferase [Candidatus Brocadia sp.]